VHSCLTSPRFDKETGLLYPSKAEFKQPPSTLTTAVLKALSTLRLIKLSTNSETGRVETTNLTILNVFLVVLGPMKEDTLVKTLISTQVRACCFCPSLMLADGGYVDC
jgi:UDP-N-acetylglucosamine--dolichyl-phosphate N-acetylglucosaminephosphotransferase